MTDISYPSKVSRKGKEKEATQAEVFLERMYTKQRSKNADARRPRERSDRTPVRATSPSIPTSPPCKPHQSPPQLLVSRTETLDASEDTQRRRRIAYISPRSHQAVAHHTRPQNKLYNPDSDPIPMRRTAEPDAMSDDDNSSYALRNGQSSQDRGLQQGRLFDYRKDDPMRFNVLARSNAANGRPIPTPKSSGEYVSASSTSSYAHSITSSNFTLSSTTDGSSASSALFEQQHREHSGTSAFAAQLKKLYRGISNLESKLLKEDGRDADEGRITLKRPNDALNVEPEEAEKERWRKFIADHKQLAEAMHNLLELTLAPHVPASLRNIPTKYNIIVRLWTHAFNKPLETLRRASFQSSMALEHLQEYINYAYTFYTVLLEEQTLEGFKSGWLEALGDLARYRMAIAAMTNAPSLVANTGEFISVNSQALAAQTQPDGSLARIDDSPGPSVGVAAAQALELEPEKERWRCIAREWYAAGLTDTPGAGKLHHHLGLLSRDVNGEELRAVYHFVKSMTTLHPFPTSRESILPIWSADAQTRRAQPDARVADLFVLLHGMLFTNIQLDDFSPTLARFMERLDLEGAEERDWIMMAVINITSILEYGRDRGVLKSTGGIGAGKDASTSAQAAAAAAKVNMISKKMDEMEVDDNDGMEKDAEADIDVKGNGVLNVSPMLVNAQPVPLEELTYSPAFKFALQLAFEMFAYTLRKPTRVAGPFSRPSLNPYNIVMLTFLATVLKHDIIRGVLERVIPWDDITAFFSTIPRTFLSQAEGGVRLTSGCSPLPEDWCLRGMEWGGRRVYERGFWRSGEDRHAEMDVLESAELDGEVTDGIIEGENEQHGSIGRGRAGESSKRWVRIARAAASIAKATPGLQCDPESKKWSIVGELASKVLKWREEERLEREEDERRRSRRTWVDDDMDIDDDAFVGEYSEGDDSESGDEDESEEVRELKAKRRELLSMLRAGRQPIHVGSPTRASRARPRRPRRLSKHQKLVLVPGYSVLVIDTNILLSSLPMVASLVESMQWTILIPLAVITELDGISSNSNQLGEAAKEAIAYITSHIRSHALSLRVQTSKGNYLRTLTVRSEQVEFVSDSWERNMDDLILRAAVWQDDHWVDRSAILGVGKQNTTGASKVVLLTFDRNLRLKARARQLDAADEKDMAAIIKSGS